MQQQEIESLMMLREEGYLEVYFGDEAHFGLTPNVPYAWQHKDNPILLPSKKSQSLTVFGLMNINCKVYSHITTGSMNSTKLIACLDEFGASIVKKTIVILDNASIHRSKLFKAKIEEWRKLDLYIYFLPPYSPELNKIEILWRFIKYKWLPFDAFLSFQNLEKRLREVGVVGRNFDHSFCLLKKMSGSPPHSTTMIAIIRFLISIVTLLLAVL